MDIREAILKAADHIERNPGLFNYGACDIPHGCGTPGCALGWMGFFLGCDRGRSIAWVEVAIALDAFIFYERMNCLDESPGLDGSWMARADVCARTLRKYADLYHPAPSPAVPLTTWDAVAKDIGWRPSLSVGAGSGK